MNKVINKAGGIILHPKDDSLIFLIYRGKYKDWTFPKGHAERDEKMEDTAKREVKEETGLDIQIIGELPPFEYSNNEGEVKVFMYLMRATSLDLKIENVGDILEWIPKNKVIEKLSYKNTKEYFNSTLNFIEISQNNSK